MNTFEFVYQASLREAVINTCSQCGKKYIGGGWQGLGIMCKKCGDKGTVRTGEHTGIPIIDRIVSNVNYAHNEASGGNAAHGAAVQHSKLDRFIDEKSAKGWDIDKICGYAQSQMWGFGDKLKNYVTERVTGIPRTDDWENE